MFLVPWIQEGLRDAESVLLLGGRSAIASVCDGLVHAKPEALGRGSLQLVPWRLLYRPLPQAFDVACTLRNSGELFSAAAMSGRPLRVAADMDWILTVSSGEASAAEYAMGLDALVQRHGAAMMCCYDIRRMSGSLLLDVLACHRIVFTRGRLHESPFYARPP